MLRIADIMQRKLITVQPTDTLATVIDLLVERQVSGAPVVTADGQFVGIITEFALTDVLFEPSLRQTTVADYMTSDVHTVSEDDSLTLAIQIFSLYRIRRVPVVRGEELVGIVSRRDLLRQCLAQMEPLSEPLEEFLAGVQADPTGQAPVLSSFEPLS